MLEGIAQGIIANGISKGIDKLFKNKNKIIFEKLIAETQISIECSSSYLDYILDNDESKTDIKINITNNTGNSHDLNIEIIHAEINGPPMGPFSSVYKVSGQKIFDDEGKQIHLKPYSNRDLFLERFASTKNRTFMEFEQIEPYPNTPTSEYIFYIKEKKYVSTLMGFYPKEPSTYSYRGVGLVLKVNIVKDGYSIERTFYGGFARRSPDSILVDVKNFKPEFYQFLGGIYDSEMIIIRNKSNDKTEVLNTKTKITNQNLGKFNLNNKFDNFSIMVHDDSSPCGAPVDIVLPMKNKINAKIDF